MLEMQSPGSGYSRSVIGLRTVTSYARHDTCVMEMMLQILRVPSIYR